MTNAAPSSAPIILYRHPLSGHAHRVELFLSLLKLPTKLVDIDLVSAEQRSPAFLAKNPMGQVPVIEDGELVLADSNAILVYLARKYDVSGAWLPSDPVGAAQVQRWLSLAAGPLASGPATARVAEVFKRKIDVDAAKATSARLFGVMEAHLATHAALVGERMTIADIALYTYTAHVPEGGVSLAPYPAIRAWLQRIEALDGFVAMRASALPKEGA
jgi:glutathione S-transferase